MRQIPKITTSFDPVQGNENNALYCTAICNILTKILPSNYSWERDKFNSILPLVRNTLTENVPANTSFYILYKDRSNAFKFFFELISCWLLPGRSLNVISVFAADFQMPEVGPDLYTICEVMVRIDSKEELEEIQRNLPLIETQASLGVSSHYYARRILEVKGLAPNEKLGMVQEDIDHLVRRFPKIFDNDVLTEMQHVLVMCREDFKNLHSPRHLSRIISLHYLFRKSLRESVKRASEKRHLHLKIARVRQAGKKHLLCILMGVNFLHDKEIFEKRHLLSAIQNYIPSAECVENSFFANRKGSENICTLYMEIEKSGDESFTGEEIQNLRRSLPIDLKDRIEYLMHPVFMPRNEEEIMRNVLSLSSQIKYLRDLPQVNISFDEQTSTSLFFTVILVRVVRPGDKSIEEMFRRSNCAFAYLHDRSKILGYLRNKYAKEATVFRFELLKDLFLRRDHSIDLYKARQAVVDNLCLVIGEIRDFNGGMFSKQNEVLKSLRCLLGENAKYNEILLENFFYSLTPMTMRSVMNPTVLKTLFIMQLEALETVLHAGERYSMKMRNDIEYVYILFKIRERGIRDELGRVFSKLQLTTTDLTQSYVKVFDTPYIGYIYRCADSIKQVEFIQSVQNMVQAWDYKK